MTAAIMPPPIYNPRFLLRRMKLKELHGIHRVNDIFTTDYIYTGGYISHNMKNIIILLNHVKYGHILVNDYYRQYRHVDNIERGKIKFDWTVSEIMQEAICKGYPLSESKFMSLISINIAESYVDKRGMLQNLDNKNLYEDKIKQMLFEMYEKVGTKKVNLSHVAIWNGVRIIGQEVKLDTIMPNRFD